MKNITEYITSGNALKRGQRIVVLKTILSKDRKRVSRATDKGTLLSDYVSADNTVSIKLNHKHYPINYAPADSVGILE